MHKITTILFSFILFSCSNHSDNNFDKVSLGKSYKIVKHNNPFGPIKEGSLLTIYEDSSYTLITPQGKYFENRSVDSEKQLYLNLNNELKEFSKSFPSANWIKLSSFSDFPEEILLENNKALQFKETDLLSSGRNWWRVKPIQKESPKQIEQRIVAHLVYMIDYFKMVENKQSNVFSLNYLNTPFRFHRSGISLPQMRKISENWTPLFYDYEDATYAYKTLNSALKSINNYPKSTETHTQNFITTMSLMVDYIENKYHLITQP